MHKNHIAFKKFIFNSRILRIKLAKTTHKRSVSISILIQIVIFGHAKEERHMLGEKNYIYG